MSNPYFLSDGTTPHRRDTEWVVLQKILAACNQALTNLGVTVSDPTFFSEGTTSHRRDTRWKILQKILAAQNAIAANVSSGGGTACKVLAYNPTTNLFHEIQTIGPAGAVTTNVDQTGQAACP